MTRNGIRRLRIQSRGKKKPAHVPAGRLSRVILETVLDLTQAPGRLDRLDGGTKKIIAERSVTCDGVKAAGPCLSDHETPSMGAAWIGSVLDPPLQKQQRDIAEVQNHR